MRLFTPWIDLRTTRVIGLHPNAVGRLVLVNGQRARVTKLHPDGKRIKVRYEP